MRSSGESPSGEHRPGANGRGAGASRTRSFRSAAWLWGAASALMLVSAFQVFPHVQLWGLAWVAMVPEILLLARGQWRNALAQTFVFGYPFMLGVLAWVIWIGYLPWALLSFTQLAYFVIFPGLSAILAPLWRPTATSKDAPVSSWGNHIVALLICPAAWVLMEWIRSLGSLSIPWGLLSTTQSHFPALVATAQWWGAYGVSFLIVMVNCSVASVIARKGRDRVRAALLLSGLIFVIAMACVAARISTHPNSGRPLRVALIQGDIFKDDPSRWVYRQHVMGDYSRLSLTAAKSSPDIIVWPETVVPGPIARDIGLQMDVENLAERTRTCFLVGSPDFAPDGRIYNSAFAVTGQGIVGRYDKQHLVPYGEYVPGRSWLPFLDRYGVPPTDLTPGVGHAPLRTPVGSLGVMICYESMYPQIARQTANSGAEVLFVVTNDQWFGTSSAPYDHAAAAAFRAAETGRWVAQAASTGVSFFASPAGVIYQPTVMFTRRIDTGLVYAKTGETLYGRLGDWPPVASIVIIVLAVIAGLSARQLKWEG